MSFQSMAWAVEQELPALQKLVLLMLANCANHYTGQCNPSHDRLAKECGMSRDSVKRAISELEGKGLIEVRRQMQNGVNLPNQYVLRVGASKGGVGADSPHGSVPTAPTVGADSTEGRCSQHPGVGADSTTKQEVKPGSKPDLSSDPEFEEAWRLYPKRDGGNPKGDALKAWNARVRAGVPREEMLSGVRRYAAHCKRKGNVGTEFVMQAVRFFGKGGHYAELWSAAVQTDDLDFGDAYADIDPTTRGLVL
jgi:biotin operon repressor